MRLVIEVLTIEGSDHVSCASAVQHIFLYHLLEHLPDNFRRICNTMWDVTGVDATGGASTMPTVTVG